MFNFYFNIAENPALQRYDITKIQNIPWHPYEFDAMLQSTIVGSLGTVAYIKLTCDTNPFYKEPSIVHIGDLLLKS